MRFSEFNCGAEKFYWMLVHSKRAIKHKKKEEVHLFIQTK